ncbi:MAG: hypothetical protein Alpg2KO_29100 [Alphaproteobacteria bacterium]
MSLESREGLDQIPDFVGYKELLVEVEGVLRAPDVPLPSKINFEIGGTRFHIAMQPDCDSHGVLTIWCSVGFLPFTAEDPAARRHALRVVRDFTRLGAGWTPVLDGEDGVVLLSEQSIALPVTPPDLIWVAYDHYTRQRGAIEVLKGLLK